AGGQSRKGQSYEDQFGLKKRHVFFQGIVEDLYRQKFIPAALQAGDQTDLWGSSVFVPYVRYEIERTNRYPRKARELHIDNLPEDIRGEIVRELGYEAARELVLRPTLDTLVERIKYELYLDPSL